MVVASVMMPEDTRLLTVPRLRLAANRLVQATSCVLVVVSSLVAWAGGQNVPLIFASTSLAAVLAFGAIARFGTRLPARLLVTVSFDMQVIILIFATSNLNVAFTEEAHSVYAILDVYLLAYACWRSFLLYNVTIGVHHLFFTLLIPQNVWADAAAWEGFHHVSIHIVLCAILTTSFIYTVEQLKLALRSNEAALAVADTASKQARLSADQATLEQHEAERRADFARETATGIDCHLQTLFRNIVEAASDVGRSAHSVANVSRTCSLNTSEVERLFDLTTTNVEGVARSADLLAQSVDEIADRAEAAARKAQGAVAQTREASRLVEALSASGQRIGDITRIIRTVADTIDLLALSATIEAVQVGEAGQGFSTVAQNVKDLARQTSTATDEIADVITIVQNETSVALRAINAIGETIASAHDHASGIAVATARQRTMTMSIAETASTIARETADVRSQLKATLNLLVSANAMSNTLLGASTGLRHMAETSTEESVSLLGRLRQA